MDFIFFTKNIYATIAKLTPLSKHPPFTLTHLVFPLCCEVTDDASMTGFILTV
jgi:hypothetical protein